MAKIKITPDSVSVVKKTLNLKAPTGVVGTPDSTQFFRGLESQKLKRMEQLEKEYATKYPKGSVIEDSEYLGLIKGLGKNATDRQRQANKGKPGFDKNGYPLPKTIKSTMKSASDKLTGK